MPFFNRNIDPVVEMPDEAPSWESFSETLNKLNSELGRLIARFQSGTGVYASKVEIKQVVGGVECSVHVHSI